MKARIKGKTVEIPDDTIQTLFVPGPLPGQNDYLGTGNRWTYGRDKKRWAEVILVEIKRQKLKPMRNVRIYWAWAEQDMRRDPDNIMGIGKKFILDALVKGGILPNDGWKNIAGMSDTWVVDTYSPGVYVRLEEAGS